MGLAVHSSWQNHERGLRQQCERSLVTVVAFLPPSSLHHHATLPSLSVVAMAVQIIATDCLGTLTFVLIAAPQAPNPYVRSCHRFFFVSLHEIDLSDTGSSLCRIGLLVAYERHPCKSRCWGASLGFTIWARSRHVASMRITVWEISR